MRAIGIVVLLAASFVTAQEPLSISAPFADFPKTAGLSKEEAAALPFPASKAAQKQYPVKDKADAQRRRFSVLVGETSDWRHPLTVKDDGKEDRRGPYHYGVGRPQVDKRWVALDFFTITRGGTVMKLDQLPATIGLNFYSGSFDKLKYSDSKTSPIVFRSGKEEVSATVSQLVQEMGSIPQKKEPVPYANEIACSSMTLADFLKLANFKGKVTVSYGPTTVELGEKELAAIREFAAMLRPVELEEKKEKNKPTK